MKALIDGDLLLYEVGFGSEETVDGAIIPRDWSFAEELLERKIQLILGEVEATEPPLLFLTNTPRINKLLNKQRKRVDEPEQQYVENFRTAIANAVPTDDVDAKEYKGGRKQQKPHHFYNLLSHILSSYSTHIDESGLEADDAMCIHQYSRWKHGLFDTIICSRDKDLRQCPGHHYSWEVGKQASIGPIFVDMLGELVHRNPEERDAKGNLKPAKIFGTGEKFFYYQMITGDSIDAITGIKGKGPMFGYHLLKDATSPRECYELVAEKYVQAWGDRWEEKMRLMADLLWMVREKNEKGEKVLWTPPPRLESVTSGLPQTPTSDTKISSNIVEDPLPTQS